MLDFKIKTDPKTGEKYLETSLSGKLLLTTPQLNKGTAFSEAERSEFDLTGKLPVPIETIEQQAKRAYLQYESYQTDLQKNIFLNKLHDTNQVLFYKLVENHEARMLPIIYTPTVGQAIEKFSREFSQARGIYISYQHRDRIEEIIENRSNPEIDLIVVSDGGRVLGIGDQGVGAMLIPVAKLMVYTICGSINPLRTLPVMLDVGTNNEALLNDPFYLGWRHKRINDKAYDEFIELFVKAVKKKFPWVYLHWEDFGREHANEILQKYRYELCTFNDDIQGTGAVTLAALTAALSSKKESWRDQRIVIFGGGSAGIGVAEQILLAMQADGLSQPEALSRFWIIDREGLITKHSLQLTPAQKLFMRQDIAEKNMDLLTVVEKIKPTILIGCSAVAGAFSEKVIKSMANHCERPIIFPLSNPNSKAEALPEDMIRWTEGKAFIATGSPFADVNFRGEDYVIPQCNNALIFPGIGLGIIAVKAKYVSDGMINAAIKTLNQFAPVHKKTHGAILPPLDNARQIAQAIALAVARQAVQEGLTEIKSENDCLNCIQENIWRPHYLPFRRKR